jgi:hypothetical protein
MTPIKVYRDGTLKWFYGLIMIAIIGYMLVQSVNEGQWENRKTGITILGSLFFLIWLYVADPRSLFIVDEEGVKPLYKKTISWPKIFSVTISRRYYYNEIFFLMRRTTSSIQHR